MSELSPQERNRLTLAIHSSNALHNHHQRHIVSILDDGNDLSICSGTLVDVFGHLLVATAAHCIPASPNGRLWLLKTTPQHSTDGRLGFVYYAKHQDYDVGFLELNSQTARAYFGDSKQACPIERVQAAGPGRDRALVSLLGTPGERVETTEHLGLPAFVARTYAIAAVVVSVTNWPTPPPSNRAADPAVDIFLDYPAELRDLNAGTNVSAPDPGGFSGGGFWDQHYSDQGLWSAERATLFGIQSSWLQSARYLRGTQIIHWLKLVHQHFPTVRSQLEALYPAQLI